MRSVSHGRRACRDFTSKHLNKRRQLRCKPVLEELEDRNLLATGLGSVPGLTDTTPARLVTGLYYDLLHRAPGAGEVAGWAAALQAGMPVYQISLAMTTSPEHLASVIADDYWTLLQRGPSAADKSAWVQALQAGLSEEQVRSAFLASGEFYQDQGGTPANWITALYQQVLNRTPSAAEVATWSQGLQNGTARALVATAFVTSAEAHALEVTSVFQHLLARTPDSGGLAAWVAAVGRGMTPSQMLALIATSAEYAADQTLTPETPVTFSSGPNPGLHFEFASENSTVAAGYTKVPVVNYTVTRGYGWSSITGIGWRDWNTSNPLTSNFESSADATFLVDLSNGTYKLTVSLGDAREPHANVSLWANGTALATGVSTTAGQLSQTSYGVQVTNGQLSVRIASQGSANPVFALDALDIAPSNGPIANAGPAVTGNEGSAVSFSGSVTGGTAPYTYSWAFGDGTTASGTLTPSHAYTSDGSYTATLTVTDAQNLSSQNSTSVTINNVAPTVNAGGPYSGTAGVALSFSGSASVPDSNDTLTYSWEFGDGSSASGQNVSHTYAGAGTYTVKLSVTDQEGATSSATVSASVAAGSTSFPNNTSPPPLPAPTGTVIHVSTTTQLQAAVAALASGETILIDPGTYNLTDTLWVPQGINNIAIRGATNNRDDVVISGNGMSGSILYGIWVGNVQTFTIADLTLKNFVDHAIILNAGAQSPLIYNTHLIDVGEQFIKSNPDGTGGGVNNGLVEYSIIEYSTTAPSYYTNGVDVHTGDGWIIRNNLFRNIRAQGALAGPAILIWNVSKNATVEANTFINCQREIAFGLNPNQPADNYGGIIRNNFIYRSGGQNGDVAIGVFNSANTEVSYNTIIINGDYVNAIEYRFTPTAGVKILYNLTDAAITSRDGATATVTGNVTRGAQSSWFVNESIGDLHLTAAASGAIGQGVYLPEVSTDYDGQARPSSGPTDVGADER
jgi:PKD repeat protein